MPLILLGGITSKPVMNRAMREGFQFVAMARALLREPDLVNRIQADPDVRSLCIHCNKCMPSIYVGAHCVLTGPAGLRPGGDRTTDTVLAPGRPARRSVRRAAP